METLMDHPSTLPLNGDNNDIVPKSARMTMLSDTTSDLGSDIGNQSCEDFDELPDFQYSGPQSPPEKSPLLRHVVLHTISSQLEKLRDRTPLGKPTAIATSSYLAVGTSAGVVLLFDPKQVLKCCLTDKRLSEYGAVSCLSFSTTGDRLIAGHSRGHVVLWDVIAGRLLVYCNDFHLPDCPILFVQFTSLYPVAVVSDTSGSIFALSFHSGSSTSSSCLSRLLFSGAKGEALYFHVLSPATLQHCTKKLPFADSVVVVIITVASVIISTFSPSAGSIVKLLHEDLLPEKLTSPPVACWCPSTTRLNSPDQSNEKKISSTFFFNVCIGRGSILRYYVLSGSKATSRLSASRITETDCSAFNALGEVLWMCWPKPDFQLILDADERLHVLSTVTVKNSTSSPTLLHSIDLSRAGIIYASAAAFKATASGTSVSRSMRAIGDRAAYSSLACTNGQFFLLGTAGIHVLTPRSIGDRIQQLAECGDKQGAVQVILNTYRSHSVVRPVWLEDRMTDLLVDYCGIPSTSLCQKDIAAIKDLMSACMEYVFKIPDILSMIASSVQSPEIQSIFVYELLHALKREQSSPNAKPSWWLPPQVAQFVFDSLSKYRNRYEDLASFLCVVDITSLDLDRSIRFALKNSLYMPYIRLYWEALMDWKTPLTTILDTIVLAYFDSGSNRHTSMTKSGSTVSQVSSVSRVSSCYQPSCDISETISVALDFIDCLLARLYYPSRRPCSLLSEQDRLEAFDILCSRLPSAAVSAEFPLANDSNLSLTAPSTYPYLKTLLMIAPDRLLPLLSAVLDSATANEEDFQYMSWLSRRQLLVDVIFEFLKSIDGNSSTDCQILTDLNSSDYGNSSFTNVRIACYTFAVQELTTSAGQQARIYGDEFTRLVQGLFAVNTDPRAEAALFLLFRRNLLENYSSDAEILTLAEQARFYDLAGAVCLRNGWRARMLRYYFTVPAWLPRIFDFLQESIESEDEENSLLTSEQNHLNLLEVCCKYAAKLVAADSVRATRFVSDFIWDDEKLRLSFLNKLRSDNKQLLFIFLIRLRKGISDELLVERTTLASSIECEQMVATNDFALKDEESEDTFGEDDDEIENCVKTVPSVLSEGCLEMCRSIRHRLKAEGSYPESLLLMQEDKPFESLLMMLNVLKRWLVLMTTVASDSVWVSHKLDVAVRRLLRLSSKKEFVLSNPSNFPIPYQLLSEMFAMLNSETSCNQHRLSSIVGALCSIFSPATVVEAVLRSPSHLQSSTGPNLGSIRRLLNTVFAISEDDVQSLKAMSGIYSDELEIAYKNMRTIGTRGIRLHASVLRCVVCRRNPDESKVLVFGCDHIAHPSCCVNQWPHNDTDSSTNQSSNNIFYCPICAARSIASGIN